MYKKNSPGMRVYRHKCSDIATEIRATLQPALSKKLADHYILLCHWQHGTKHVLNGDYPIKKIMPPVKANAYHILP